MFILGVLTSFAFAPDYLTLPALFSLAICLFYCLLSDFFTLKKSLKKAFIFFFGFHVGNFYWMCAPLTIEFEKYRWLIPVALSVFPLYISCCMMFFITIFKKLQHYFYHNYYFSSFFLALMLFFGELTYSYLFSGFPWSLIGYMWNFSTTITQITSVIGIYGLSFLTYLFISILAHVFYLCFMTLNCEYNFKFISIDNKLYDVIQQKSLFNQYLSHQYEHYKSQTQLHQDENKSKKQSHQCAHNQLSTSLQQLYKSLKSSNLEILCTTFKKQLIYIIYNLFNNDTGKLHNNQTATQHTHETTLHSLRAVTQSLYKCGFILLLSIVLFGIIRLSNDKNESTATPIRLVQSNHSQIDRLTANEHERLFLEIYQFSRHNLPENTKMIIWPEVSYQDLLTKESTENLRIELLDLMSRCVLATGVITHTNNSYYNSIAFLLPNESCYVYNKSHLVPFGEYIPLRFLLKYINTIASEIGDFNRGTGAKLSLLPGIPPFLSTICYESIFSDEIINDLQVIDEIINENSNEILNTNNCQRISQSKIKINNIKQSTQNEQGFYTDYKQPTWILNITNDSWFVNMPVKYHFAKMCMIRAIETGLPFVRVSNDGVSYVFNAYGKIIKKGKIKKIEVIDVNIPQHINSTLYRKHGKFAWQLMLWITLLLTILIENRRKRQLKFKQKPINQKINK